MKNNIIRKKSTKEVLLLLKCKDSETYIKTCRFLIENSLLLPSTDYSKYSDFFLDSLKKGFEDTTKDNRTIFDVVLDTLGIEDKIRMVYRVKGEKELDDWIAKEKISVRKLIDNFANQSLKNQFLNERIPNEVNLDYPSKPVSRSKPLLQGLKITIG